MAERQGSELIIGGKDDDRLYHIGYGRRQKVPTNIVLVGDPKRVDTVTEFFDNGRVEGTVEHREFVTKWGRYKGVPVAAMGTGIGTDNTEIAIIERMAADEWNPDRQSWDPAVKRTIIRVGTSGSPQKDIPLGSLAIGEHAIGLDNTGLSYLHHPRVEDYADKEFGPFYTPGNRDAKAIFESVRALLSNSLIRPYVSTLTPYVARTLHAQARVHGFPDHEGPGVYSGITTSAPGFFAPQGRSIGRLGNIAIPDLQDRLAEILVPRFSSHGRPPLRPLNNEMESSVLGRLNGEILGDNVGAVCLVIANRQEGSFISADDMQKGIRKAIKVALDTIYSLQ